MKKEYIINDMNDELKEGEDILFSCGEMIGSGTVFKIMFGRLISSFIIGHSILHI